MTPQPLLPLLPTTPFLLLAAWFFARSHPEWEAKLLAHPRWGPLIRDWRATDLDATLAGVKLGAR